MTSCCPVSSAAVSLEWWMLKFVYGTQSVRHTWDCRRGGSCDSCHLRVSRIGSVSCRVGLAHSKATRPDAAHTSALLLRQLPRSVCPPQHWTLPGQFLCLYFIMCRSSCVTFVKVNMSRLLLGHLCYVVSTPQYVDSVYCQKNMSCRFMCHLVPVP